MQSNINPVFVIGIYRSGTSLLYALLNQHPQIALMYECNILDFPDFFSKQRFKRNWLERQEFYNQALSRHRLIFANRLHGLEEVQTPEELYRTYGNAKQAALVGEKSPPYCPRLRQLARRYPNASFILLWRDPIEIYRSIVHAGHQAPFFNRIGIHRLIFFKEQMIRQAAELEFAGAKLHHVNYDDLVDRPEDVCRGICQFLKIEFEPAMLNLASADLSAVHDNHYRKHLHGHLQRGVIERRTLDQNGLDAEVVDKLERFHARWYRLGGKRMKKSGAETEPSFRELFYHRTLGRILFVHDTFKRTLFEFLPLPWLLTYRRTKKWFTNGQPTRPSSVIEEFSAHRITILISCLLLGLTAWVDVITDPQLVLMPMYLIPCALPALIINRRWGTIAAVADTLVWTAARVVELPDYSSQYGLLLWNCLMRFLVLEFVVILLDRIRLEIADAETE